jgi:hypothetical protein
VLSTALPPTRRPGRLVLVLVVMAACGCGQAPPVKSRPTIVRGEPYDFGPITESAADPKGWFLGVVAADPDLNATLTARLFWKSGDQYIRLSDDIILSPAPGLGDATDREGKFASTTYCTFLGKDAEQFVYAYVSNALYGASMVGFPDDTSKPSDISPGTFDSKYWVVTCK